MSLGRVLSIINAPAYLEEEKNKKFGEIERKIDKISKMKMMK